MNTNSSALIVPPPNQSGITSATTNDIRGLKGPVEVPIDWEGYLWLLAFLAAGIALLIWNRFMRRLRQRLWAHLFKKPEPKPIPAHVRARQRLHAALHHISDPRAFCFEVSEALRVYLEERFELRAPERTTEEFLLELKASNALNVEQKHSLAAFLESCDLVKFARFEPHETALRELHDSALHLVDETQFDAVAQPTPASAVLAQ
jgi:hypothetical protein